MVGMESFEIQVLNEGDLVFAQPDPSNASKQPPESKKRDKNKCHICPICSLSCSSLKVLESHLKQHPGEKPYSCSECPFKTGHPSYLRLHRRLHSGEQPYKCQHCDFKTAHGSALRIHVRRHTGERPYSCTQCEYAGVTRQTLRLHMRVHLKLEPAHELNCEHCSFTTHDLATLDEHMTEHPNEKLTLMKNVRRMYRCSECDYSCRLQASLRVHQMKHKSLPNIKCALCSYKSYTRQAMKIHFRRQHSDDRRYFECPQCLKKFTAASSLQVHTRLHTGERPYPCTVCSFRAISRTALKEHMIRHESDVEKPFPCFLCDARFNWPHEWQEHLFVHKDDNFQKSKYCCPHCDFSAPLFRSLSSHITVKHRELSAKSDESPFCSDCNYQFKNRKSFRKHNRICHRDRPLEP